MPKTSSPFIPKTSALPVQAAPRAKYNDARVVALKVLLAVHQRNMKLDDALGEKLIQLEDRRERSFAQHLSYSVLRWQVALDGLYQQLVNKPLSSKDLDIKLIIQLGLEQLWHANTPAHAAINTAVELTKKQKKVWARGLVNAVLRRFQREQEVLLEGLKKTPSEHFSCPDWLLRRWQKDWPNQWETVAEASIKEPPLWLRVNLNKNSVTDFQAVLETAEIKSASVSNANAAILLPQALPVMSIPGFAEGAASVQDISAQLAAGLLQVQPGERVLDACAAPGGKTAQLLEQYPGIELTAIDNKADRLEKLKENLKRLGLVCKTLCADANDPNTWWDQQPYDRILLDAPCSASGVIRRHPDIKLRLESVDIKRLQQQQIQLLQSLWQVLRPGGMLVYVTCSILNDENQASIKAFSTKQEDVEIQECRFLVDEKLVPLSFGRAVSPGWQVLPGDKLMPAESEQISGGDGLYFACLRKRL